MEHRRNDPDRLAAVPRGHGVEMDLHSLGDRLVVHHDPGSDGADYGEWLAAYSHRMAVLNVKEEGIEARVRDMAVAAGITDFFMLDLSFPALIKMVRGGERRVAVRVSDYEPAAGALLLAGLVDWVWLDLFSPRLPVDAAEYGALRDAGFRVCLVSPELHGREVDEIAQLQSILIRHGMVIDAVCTKQPTAWEGFGTDDTLKEQVV